ncbi:MAG: DUF4956 domain-containing protein [Anaerovoracaceae bacterium]
MREIIANMLEESGTLTVEAITMHIIVAAFLSAAVFVSYWYTHVGTAYSKKFNVSLVTLTILTATVMTVIGNNIALSLGMVGALSIVRFRTAIKDSRDTTYIFWAIVTGICCGVGDYVVAAIGSGVIFLVMLLLGRVKNENRILLIIRASRSVEQDIESIVFDYFNKKALLKVKNTSPDSVEMIFEMTRSIYALSYKREKSITEKIYDLNSVEYVNVVTQSDEISG